MEEGTTQTAASFDGVAVANRLKTARASVGLTLAEFANKFGTSKSGLSQNEIGKTVPSAAVLAAFVAAGISSDWILTGKGSMLINAVESIALTTDLSEDELRLLTNYRKTNRLGKRMLIEASEGAMDESIALLSRATR